MYSNLYNILLKTTPAPDPVEKRQLLPESTPVLRLLHTSGTNLFTKMFPQNVKQLFNYKLLFQPKV